MIADKRIFASLSTIVGVVNGYEGQELAGVDFNRGVKAYYSAIAPLHALRTQEVNSRRDYRTGFKTDMI